MFDEDADEALSLRPDEWRAETTRSISEVVRASPPFSALMRFLAFLRSRFLSLLMGLCSGSSMPAQKPLVLGEGRGEEGV